MTPDGRAPNARELELVRLVLAGDAAGFRAAVRASGRLDPAAAERLVAFARDHRIAGHLCGLLRGRGLLEVFPEAARRRLEASHRDAVRLSEDRLAEAARLAPRLREACVDVLYLKGPFLARRHFERWRERFTWDTDLMLRRPADLRRAARVLEAAGYERRGSAPLGRRALVRFTHDVEFERDGRPLDLHWAFGNHHSLRIDYEGVWRRRERRRVGGRAYDVPGVEDEVVLLALGVIRDVERGRLRLKSAIDLDAVLRSADDGRDWGRFVRRCRAEGIEEPLAAAVHLVADLLGTPEAHPGLRAQLRPAPDRGRRPGGEAARLLEHSRHGLRNKRWTFGLYRGGWLRSFGWWALSQPVRRRAHRES